MFSKNKYFRSILSYNHKYLIFDNTEKLIENLDDIWTLNEDTPNLSELIFNCQVKTTGLVNVNFTYKGNKFVLYDTGGQRNERKKWINIFDNVDAVIFVGALSQFNELCYEDEETNKMVECLSVVEDLSFTKQLSNSPFYLYLNKHDVFIKELKKDTIQNAFPDCPNELVKLHEFHMNQSPLKKTFSWNEKNLIKKESSFNIIKNPGNGSINIQFLSIDELSYVLSFLDYKHAVKFSRINSLFYDSCNSDLLWESFCLRFDSTLDHEKIESFYDRFSEYPPWKYYFIQGKTAYLKIRDFIVDEFIDTFGKSGREFRSIYTTTANDSKDDHFISVFESTLDDILTLKNKKKYKKLGFGL